MKKSTIQLIKSLANHKVFVNVIASVVGHTTDEVIAVIDAHNQSELTTNVEIKVKRQYNPNPWKLRRSKPEPGKRGRPRLTEEEKEHRLRLKEEEKLAKRQARATKHLTKAAEKYAREQRKKEKERVANLPKVKKPRGRKPMTAEEKAKAYDARLQKFKEEYRLRKQAKRQAQASMDMFDAKEEIKRAKKQCKDPNAPKRKYNKNPNAKSKAERDLDRLNEEKKYKAVIPDKFVRPKATYSNTTRDSLFEKYGV